MVRGCSRILEGSKAGMEIIIPPDQVVTGQLFFGVSFFFARQGCRNGIKKYSSCYESFFFPLHVCKRKYEFYSSLLQQVLTFQRPLQKLHTTFIRTFLEALETAFSHFLTVFV